VGQAIEPLGGAVGPLASEVRAVRLPRARSNHQPQQCGRSDRQRESGGPPVSQAVRLPRGTVRPPDVVVRVPALWHVLMGEIT
jgi:hypothetical protein